MHFNKIISSIQLPAIEKKKKKTIGRNKRNKNSHPAKTKFRESGCEAAIVASHKRGRNDDLARSTIRDGWVTSVVMGCERLLVRGNLFDPFFLCFFFFFFFSSLPLLLFHLLVPRLRSFLSTLPFVLSGAST